jgi:hypothetical protein
VTAALLDVVSTHNCFSLFNVAAACGCAPLQRKAAALALSAFPQALQNDVNGLLTMQEGHLMQLLCSDRLQVSGSRTERGREGATLASALVLPLLPCVHRIPHLKRTTA